TSEQQRVQNTTTQFLLDVFKIRARLRHIRLIPLQGALFPYVDEPDQKDAEKNPHFNKTKKSHLAKENRPRIEENDFEIENQKQHRHQIEPYGKADACVAPGRVTGFERFRFDRIRRFRTHFLRDEKQAEYNGSCQRKQDE